MDNKGFDELLGDILNTTLQGQGDSDQHLMTLFSIVLQTKAKKILELGVRNGDTSLPLALGAYLTGGKVQAIDIADTNFRCPDLLKPHYQFIKSEAIQLLTNPPEQQYDIVYVDDWHSYKHVKKELELIDKITTNKSLILLHDLMGCKSEPNYLYSINSHPEDEWGEGGPFAAVNELDKNIWEWSTIPVNNGLTILRKI